MSTSRSPENLHGFVQDGDIPVLLDIDCPAMTLMALMEGGELGMEDEYLLGCRTRFEVIGVAHITDAHKFEVVEWGNPHKEMFKVYLRVTESPKYTKERETFTFDPTT
jgi:hypothetical protein